MKKKEAFKNKKMAISALEELKRSAEANLNAKPGPGAKQYFKDWLIITETAISALRGPTREQVEKLRGEWLHDTDTGYEVCDRCSHTISLDDYLNRNPPPFCENCGSPMTDKAVDILLRRLEAMYDDTGD